jgi:hypothetical protein
VFVLGCGRIGFDSGGAAALTCGHGLAAPARVTVSGHTFTFTSYTTTGPVPDVPVAVHAFDDPVVLASSKSDANGAYSLSVATGGIAHELVVDFTHGGYLFSTVYTGATVDRDTVVDGPTWNDPEMDSVYGTGGVATRDMTRGQISIGVYACDGTPFTGATVAIDPPPERLDYIGDDGPPSRTQTSIGTVNPFAFAFNAPAGPTTVRALAPGARFTAQQVDVTAGDHVTIVFLYPDAD